MINSYLKLIRFDKPIGTLLLLWPVLTALVLASKGMPDYWILFVFIFGTFLARSAGCVINDFFDRDIDINVSRTKARPIAAGEIKPVPALIFCGILFFIAFLLVLTLNKLTIIMAVIALVLACFYPLMKRITQVPQVWLGIAFNWGVLMAFTAVLGRVTVEAVLLYVATLLLTVAYDTQYAMVDRVDDLNIGVKSTAILFGVYDRLIILVLQLVAFGLLFAVGVMSGLMLWFYLGLVLALVTIIYQQYLIKDRDPAKCFQAFLNNNLTLFLVFLGVLFEIFMRY